MDLQKFQNILYKKSNKINNKKGLCVRLRNWEGFVNLNSCLNAEPVQENKLEKYFFRKQIDWYAMKSRKQYMDNYIFKGNKKNDIKTLSWQNYYMFYKNHMDELTQKKIFERYLFSLPYRAKMKVKSRNERQSNAWSTGLDYWRRKQKRYNVSFSMASKVPLLPAPFQKLRFWRALSKQRSYIFSESEDFERKHWRKQIYYEKRLKDQYALITNGITHFDEDVEATADYRRKYKFLLSRYNYKKKFEDTDLFLHFPNPRQKVGQRSIWRTIVSRSKYWKEKRKMHKQWHPKFKLPKRPLRKFQFLI